MSPPANRLLPFIARVGSGHKGAKDLTYDEAREAMNAVLDGAFHPITLGVFLLAERWKEESPEELAGFADAMRERCITPPTPLPGALDSAGAYDGKTRTLNIAIPAALLAAAAGQPVLMHGATGIPTKMGVTTAHVLERLGIPVGDSPAQARDRLERTGLAYLHQPAFNPAVHALLELRLNVGKRTLVNTVEPLASPLGAGSHIGGIFHLNYGPLVAQSAAHAQVRPFARVLIVQGIEGSDEIRPGKAQLSEWRAGGEVVSTQVDSAALGLDCAIADANASEREPETLIAESAQRIESLARGEAPTGYRDLVLLNAALRLYAGGLASTMEEGTQQARRALDNGGVGRVLTAWREASDKP